MPGSTPRFLVLGLLLVLARTALAADGLVEINQACAAGAGCFDGDAAGFPVQITGAAGKSYVLTGDLVVASASATAIDVTTDDVSIDFHGFAIRGPTVCSGTPLSCSPLGSGMGVRAGTLVVGLAVRDGTVRGMGNAGLSLGELSSAERMRLVGNGSAGFIGHAIRESVISSNGAVGISLGSAGRAENNTVTANGLFGISAGSRTLVAGNAVERNASNGINGASHSLITGNHVIENGQAGISCGSGASITENRVAQSGADAISCLDGCAIRGNAVFDNGDATNAANDDGIDCDDGCGVQGNTVRENAGFGLRLGADSAYGENTITGNATGGVTGGTARGGNLCAGTGVVSANCP